MRRGPATVLVMALAFSFLSPDGPHARAQRSDGPEKKDPLKDSSLWMKQKLTYTQKILEGMTRGDYDLIAKQAQGMENLAMLEGWLRADRPGYRVQMHAFGHANAELIRSAKERNLDGVTLAYAQLTISCVQCHKIVRDKSLL